MTRFSITFEEKRNDIGSALGRVLNGTHIIAENEDKALEKLFKNNLYPVIRIIHIEEIKGEVYYGKKRK